MVGLIETSKKAHAKGHVPDCLCQCHWIHSEPLPTHAFIGDPPRLAGRSGSISHWVTATFLFVLVCTRLFFSLQELWCAQGCFFLASKSWVCASPSPVEVLQSNSDSLQSQIPWEFLVCLMSPRAWKPDVGLRFFTTVENLFGIIILQFVDCPPCWYRIWFYHGCAPLTILLLLLLYPWIWGVFFLMGSSILLSMVVQHLVAILVHSQEEMSTCPSTPPSCVCVYIYVMTKIELFFFLYDLHAFYFFFLFNWYSKEF